MNNICTTTDSYKIGHPSMYPDGTTGGYSYFEPRKGARFNKTMLFGLQYIMMKHLEGQVVTKEKIDFAESLLDQHFGQKLFKRENWEHILEKHGGRLPVRIKAVPEGTLVPTDNVLLTIESTDPECYWLPGHLDPLLTQLWAPSTVATLSREIKIMLKHYLEQTADNHEGLNFMLHDFGFRGATCVEAAAIQGAGHMINFMGTDTLPAIELGMKYYDSDVCAFSVPATEHTIMTSLGPDGEEDLFRMLLKRFPTGVLSVVIDSYNYENFITNIAQYTADTILKRDGKLVFRPDSGEPVTTTIRTLELLEQVFGTTKNSKGYKVLNPKVGCLWGDGIRYEETRNILHAMKEAGYSAENIVFGMGGGLHSSTNRDTQRFAFKSSAQHRNGKWHDIYKRPTEISKASKRGFQYLYQNPDGSLYTSNVIDTQREDILQTVFENGEIKIKHTFDEIRERAKL